MAEPTDADRSDRNGLEVLECGRGRSVVLVHGSASDHRTWAGQREHWCDRFRLVAYSRRYHWPNPPIEPGGVYSLDDHVADLRRLILDRELAPAAVVGHSYGGVVALELAGRWPELVDALVVAEPPVLGLFGTVPPTPLQLLKLALRRPRTALGILELGVRSLEPAAEALERDDGEAAMRRMGVGILGEAAFEALSEERRAQVLANQSVEELRSPEALSPIDTETVAAIRCPVLLLGGDRSPPLFARLLDYLQELLPEAERATIPDASHIVHEDTPDAFHRAVESFL